MPSKLAIFLSRGSRKKTAPSRVKRINKQQTLADFLVKRVARGG